MLTRRDHFESAKTLGLTYFDCANVYGLGASEEVVGQLLSEIYARDEFVLTTKVAMPMGRSAPKADCLENTFLNPLSKASNDWGLIMLTNSLFIATPTPFQASLGFPSKKPWKHSTTS